LAATYATSWKRRAPALPPPTSSDLLALDVFIYQVKKAIAGGAAVMNGLDAIAFTGGIGENSPPLRRAICEGLSFLGVLLDPSANEDGAGDRLLSSVASRVKVVALATNEELIVARRAYRVLSAQ